MDLIIFGNLKLFWSFVLCVCKGFNELMILKVDNIILIDDVDIVEMMNFYFLLVFILEDYVNFFEYDNIVDMKLLIIYCKISEIFYLFRNLNLNKFFWFDFFLLCVMKECVVEMVDLLYLFLNRLFFFG